MNLYQRGIIAVICTAWIIVIHAVVASTGTIEPGTDAFDSQSGLPKATMKTLQQVEPRVPIFDLPFTITNPGSYYLGQMLEVTSATHGIIISSENVKLDLNGFSLWGNSNGLNAIHIPHSNELHNISIANGVIAEWNGWGINATNAEGVVVSDIKMFMNQVGGMQLGWNANVSDCDIAECGGPAIRVGDAGKIKDCKAMECNGPAFKTGHGSRITGSSAFHNYANGIEVMSYCQIKDCLAVMNYTNGIVAMNSCLVMHNNVGDNGMTNQAGAGILVTGAGNRIENNNLTFNFMGLNIVTNPMDEGGGNRISFNSMMGNVHGLRDTQNGNLIFQNTVSFSESNNWIITGMSHFGNIVTNPGPGFANPNPWCNFELNFGP